MKLHSEHSLDAWSHSADDRTGQEPQDTHQIEHMTTNRANVHQNNTKALNNVSFKRLGTNTTKHRSYDNKCINNNTNGGKAPRQSQPGALNTATRKNSLHGYSRTFPNAPQTRENGTKESTRGTNQPRKNSYPFSPENDGPQHSNQWPSHNCSLPRHLGAGSIPQATNLSHGIMSTHKTIHTQHKATNDQLWKHTMQTNLYRSKAHPKQTPRHLKHSDLGPSIKKQIQRITSPKIKANKSEPHSTKNSHPQIPTDSLFHEFSTLLKRGFTKMTSVTISATNDIPTTNQNPSTNQRSNMSSTSPTRSSKRKTDRYLSLLLFDSSHKQSIWVQCPYRTHMGIAPSLTGDKNTML